MTNKDAKGKVACLWTMNEDLLIFSTIKEAGSPTKWSHMSKMIPNKTAKQFRERWNYHLNPLIKKTKWSREEDWACFFLEKKLPNKWSKISIIIEGRAENNIKNHWHSTLKR